MSRPAGGAVAHAHHEYAGTGARTVPGSIDRVNGVTDDTKVGIGAC